MDLHDVHVNLGATLAADGIPLHYGDLKAEYEAGLERAVLMDRSHEVRLLLTGRDRFAVPQRMSTNDLSDMRLGEGRATIFTNPNARILDRVIVYNRGEDALMLGGPGRGPALQDYLQRNIFFGDQLAVSELSSATALMALHGPRADAVVAELNENLVDSGALQGAEIMLEGVPVFVARNKPVSGAHWLVIAPREQAAALWKAVLAAGDRHGLIPAGSLTYNTLRIRAGIPGVGRELSPEYIPLEVGLWDEVSFSKGCYTGQEIIARMESRNRLARTMVRLQLSGRVDAPAEVYHDGRRAGMLTSSVVSPSGEIFGIAVVRTRLAQPGVRLALGAPPVEAHVIERAGVQPEYIDVEEAEA